VVITTDTFGLFIKNYSNKLSLIDKVPNWHIEFKMWNW